MTLRNRFSTWSVVFLAALSLSAGPKALAAESAQEKERKLVGVLQSDAPPQEKAITCKKLAVYGSKDAVPALAALLPNQELSSWARIALEVIPDPAADAALREAVGKVNGRLLIGVMNSIGVRRDAKAVAALAPKLQDADAGVASAAAEALGRIGGEQAAKALEQSLAGAQNSEVRSSIALGCIYCAEKYAAEGKSAEATRLFDTIRQANVPKQRILEANRGAVLARQNAGIPLLLEQLRSTDKAIYGMALRTARELPGREVTEALVAEMDKINADRQLLLLQAVADRNDPAVRTKLLQVAKSGSTQLRTAAISLLDRFADLSCVPVLLDAAADNDAELARAGKSALARLGGKEVDADFLTRLPQSSGKTREVLLELARQRNIAAVLPIAVQSVAVTDEGVRRAALETIAAMGTEQQVAELVGLLAKAPAKDRDSYETALTTICGRSGAKCLPSVMPLAQKGETDLRKIGLHALASIGGPEALGTVKAAVNDQDENVQNEAVSILATWPNKWPEDSAVAEPLLALAKSGKKTSHQLQGLRGYLLFIQEDKKLSNDEKLGKINELMGLIKRPEEKRLLISVVSELPAPGALERLITFADDRDVAEEACMAMVSSATSRSQKNAPKELRRKALQTAVEKSKNTNTRKRAEDGLSKIQ